MELKLNDLRVGNYLYNAGSVVTVSEIRTRDEKIRHVSKIGKESGCYSINSPHLKPIPLTEELLYRFGFEPTYWAENGMLATYRINGSDFLTSKMKLFGHNIQVDYVHQLQNLYFDLKREEINLTL